LAYYLATPVKKQIFAKIIPGQIKFEMIIPGCSSIRLHFKKLKKGPYVPGGRIVLPNGKSMDR
jgi:hypothetical protein